MSHSIPTQQVHLKLGVVTFSQEVIPGLLIVLNPSVVTEVLHSRLCRTTGSDEEPAQELEEESCKERAEGRNGRFRGVSRAQTAVTKARTHGTNNKLLKELSRI